MKENGTYESYKKKRADDAKERRKRNKNALMMLTVVKRNQYLSEERMKCRKRVQKHRRNKKKNDTPKEDLQSSSYRTKSALRKATTKIRKTLPLSPKKRNAVLARLIHSLDAEDQEAIFCRKPLPETMRNNGKALASEVVVAVQKFYENDEISRMSPNVKDCRSFTDPVTGTKEIVQTRHLMYRLKEVYELFLIDYASRSGNTVEIRFIVTIHHSYNCL